MNDETRDKTLVKKYFGNERNPDDRTMGQACERLRSDAYAQGHSTGHLEGYKAGETDGWNAAIDKIISLKRDLYSPVTTASLENYIKELESLKQ